jgi:soluble lytic murein transglycosylase
MAADRIEQAREVVGETFADEWVRPSTTRKDLFTFTESEVSRRLPASHRSQSHTITKAIFKESARYRFDPLFLVALIEQESKFNPSAVGTHGEIGLIQIKPSTAKWIAGRVGIAWKSANKLFNPQFNLKVGAAYINYLRARYKNQGPIYLTAYNHGPQSVRHQLRSNSVDNRYSSSVSQHYVALYQAWTHSAIETRLVASR